MGTIEDMFNKMISDNSDDEVFGSKYMFGAEKVNKQSSEDDEYLSCSTVSSVKKEWSEVIKEETELYDRVKKLGV